jgi:hypothetical protein
MEPRTLAGIYRACMYEAFALIMLAQISLSTALRVIRWRLQPHLRTVPHA